MERNPKAVIRIKGRAFDFTCPLGNGRPKRTAGGAEYESVKRPNADAVTVFTGNGLDAIDVPVLFDGWGPPGKRADIGPHVDQIVALCYGDGKNPPPSFIASYPGPGSGVRYQMALPEELDEPKPIAGEGGTLFRQALVLKLVEFNDPSDIRWRTRPGANVGKSRNGGTEAAPTSIVLTRPENLLQVSAKVYGTPQFADKLGDLNGIKDIRKKQATGKRIKLPKGWPGED